MKRKIKSIILTLFVAFVSVLNVNALSINETTDTTDSYDTISDGTIIIGITKFDSDVILTAKRASVATANDLKFKLLEGKDVTQYSSTIYYYLSGTWFSFDEDNIPSVVSTQVANTLKKIAIYYVDNEEKVIEYNLDYTASDNEELKAYAKDETRKNDIKIEGNKILVPATIFSFDLVSKNTETNNETVIDSYVKESNSSTSATFNKVTVVLGDTAYDTLKTAFTKAPTGSTLKLVKDIDLDGFVSFSKKSLTLDLNGHKITGKTDTKGEGLIKLLYKGELTITGDGTIDSATNTNNSSIAIWLSSSTKLTINGGTFTNLGAKDFEDNGTPNNNELIYLEKTSEVIINGGKFIGNSQNKTHGASYTLNINDSYRTKASIKVYGGTFVDYDPSNITNEGSITTYVVDGYKVNKDGSNYTVVKDN